MATQLKSGDIILFIGDSITDCGWQGPNGPLGAGYVKLFADLLVIRRPTERFTILNKGISGQTIVELQERWTDDVLNHKPDWLVVMIGINDLCRWVTNGPNSVPPERYERVYDELLGRTRRALPRCGILLLEPFYITQETSTTSIRYVVLSHLSPYRAAVRHVARHYGTNLLRTHTVFRRLLQHHKPETFCPEPIHPNATGHLVIAEAVYTALNRASRPNLGRPRT